MGANGLGEETALYLTCLSLPLGLGAKQSLSLKESFEPLGPKVLWDQDLGTEFYPYPVL